MTPHLQIILWKDLFVIVDDGRAAAVDYPRLGELVVDQAKRHAGGIGALAVIPSNARPPSPQAREAISALLTSLDGDLRCACWLVEGGGFQAAMVRAVLTGLRMFGHYPYATHVSTDMDESIGWLLPHLSGGNRRKQEVGAASHFIATQRAGGLALSA
jgi:hypothetical protein